MRKNFHELFDETKAQPPSERSTGIVFAAVAGIVSVVNWSSPVILSSASILSVLLLVTAFIRPKILKPLNSVWFKFGLLLHRIVNPVVMLLMFAVAIVPAGLIMRIWRDPLRLKREKDGATYWVLRDQNAPWTSSMTNQF